MWVTVYGIGKNSHNHTSTYNFFFQISIGVLICLTTKDFCASTKLLCNLYVNTNTIICKYELSVLQYAYAPSVLFFSCLKNQLAVID